ncbi:MAG: 5'/3'-nucleotidase SurE [Planctomycetes bacterium]|nr:5'/3'-nucleotidase SurE [Planctomycetota bacterium]NOG55479.1 5'/3'-nucleotidase SurE [Planctomycetota bacterium]
MELLNRIVAVVSAIAICTIASAQSPDSVNLHILLTNDDGYDAPGLMAMHDGLVKAGHRVTIVAPAEPQSGSSVRISGGPFTVLEKGDDAWTVTGSPADCVLIGLHHVLNDDRPDLVISGPNFGTNLSVASNSSGTLGAAVAAMTEGVPAFAVSVGINMQERSTGFQSTINAFAESAGFVSSLIDVLHDTRANSEEQLLPEHTLLNINYPALAPADIKGVRCTQLSRLSPYRWSYRETSEPGVLARRIAIEYTDTSETADTTWFARGYITLSPLDGDWSADTETLGPLRERMADLPVPGLPDQ